ncbi:MAG: hypothetical protein V2A58_15085 [Planctomycetota bacterium]
MKPSDLRFARRSGQVNTVLVVMIVLALGGLTAAYVCYARSDELRNQLEQARAQKTELEKRLGETRAAIEEWQRVVGLAIDVARAKVDSFQPKLVPPRDSLAGMILTLEEKRTEALYLLQVAQGNLEQARKDLEGAQATYEASRREKEAELKAAQDGLAKATAELKSVEQDFRTQISKLQQDRVQAERELRKMREDLQEKERGYDLEVQRLKIGLRARLEELRGKTQEFIGQDADGSIIFVRAALGVTTIDLGEKQGVKAGMVFKVFRRDETGERIDKGRVRVRTTEANASVASVVDTARDHPMIPGDLIETPLYPEGARFCIIGLFPKKKTNYVYSFEDLAKMIENFGGIVVPDVTLDTDYVIEGFSTSYPNLILSDFITMGGQELEDLRKEEVERGLGRKLPELSEAALQKIMDSDVERRNEAIEFQTPVMTAEEFLQYIVR